MTATVKANVCNKWCLGSIGLIDTMCKLWQNKRIHYIVKVSIKSNQKQIYIAPYVASESEAHGGDD